MNNFLGFLFLCAFFDKNLTKNVHWMNYLIVAASLIAIPILLLTKESYARLELDDNDNPERQQGENQEEEEEEEQQILVQEDELQNEQLVQEQVAWESVFGPLPKKSDFN